MQLTILFEAPFYVGILEQERAGQLFAARIVFGAEPNNAQVYAFVLEQLNAVCASMTAGVPATEAPSRPINPKRQQREIAKLLAEGGVRRKAHEALNQQREQSQQTRQTRRTQTRQAERQARWEQRQPKARRKRRGQ